MFDRLRPTIETSTTIAAFGACAWLTAGPIAGLVTACVVAGVIWYQLANRDRDFAASLQGLDGANGASHIGAAGFLNGRPARSSSGLLARGTRP